jgi:hypothetical protein
MRSAYAGVCVLSCVCQGGAVSSFAGLPSRTPSLPTRQPAPTRHAQLGKALALKRWPKPTSANPSPFRSVAGVSVQNPPGRLKFTCIKSRVSAPSTTHSAPSSHECRPFRPVSCILHHTKFPSNLRCCLSIIYPVSAAVSPFPSPFYHSNLP